MLHAFAHFSRKLICPGLCPLSVSLNPLDLSFPLSKVGRSMAKVFSFKGHGEKERYCLYEALFVLHWRYDMDEGTEVLAAHLPLVHVKVYTADESLASDECHTHIFLIE